MRLAIMFSGVIAPSHLLASAALYQAGSGVTSLRPIFENAVLALIVLTVVWALMTALWGATSGAGGDTYGSIVSIMIRGAVVITIGTILVTTI